MSVSAGSLSAEPEVDLTTLRWSLQKGFDESYLNLEKTKLDSSKWKPVKGFPIKIFEHSDERENFATFSLLTYFDLPAQIINNPRQPGIAFGEIGEVFEVYINGNLVAAEGFNRDGKIFHRTVRGVVYEIKPSYLKEKDNQLLIKIQGDPRYEHTGLYLNQFYKIGIYQKLKSASRDTLALVLTGLYLFVGLYHFLLTLKRPQDTYNLYFAICCVLIFIYLMTRDHIVFDFGIDTILIQRTELIVLYAFGVFLNRFVDVMVLGEVSRFVRYYSYLCVLLILPPLLLPMRYGEQPFLMIWQAATIGVMLPRGMYHIAKDSRKGSRDSRRLLMGMTIFAFAAIFDVVDSAYLNTGLAYTKYGFAVFILGIAVILANRFLRVHNEVEELNTNLEQKVEARTAELQNTLEEISNLKEKQDGDYFLTSLLLKPLAKNEVDSDSVNVEFLTRQHKRFHFRKWDEELGGDMSIAHTIVLRDKTYTVFLNGDAMGKSLQGAGGALVLGVVYNSLISRTRSDIHRHLFPEHWIREAYRELQDIFVSFDGSMLISVVIGLLEDETGMLYFLNAEHPEVVLYRNNTAEFLHEKTLRKIGTTGINRFLVVNTFQLKPDDVIFVGSDGRDDILMGLDEEGNRIINDDENEFSQKGGGRPGAFRRDRYDSQKTGRIDRRLYSGASGLQRGSHARSKNRPSPPGLSI